MMLPLVDEFRTLNWIKIKSNFEFSKIFEMFPGFGGLGLNKKPLTSYK